MVTLTHRLRVPSQQLSQSRLETLYGAGRFGNARARHREIVHSSNSSRLESQSRILCERTCWECFGEFGVLIVNVVRCGGGRCCVMSMSTLKPPRSATAYHYKWRSNGGRGETIGI